jgi:hypothetical protein
MSSDSAQIVQQIHREFQELVEYVTGDESQSRTAYEVELTLFRRLLALGRSCCGCSSCNGPRSDRAGQYMRRTERK